MHPRLDLVDQIIRILGWPTLLGGLGWAIRKWDDGQRDFKVMGENTRIAVAKIATVETEVLAIKNNHLAHLQEGIVALSASKAVEILQTISKDIAVLVDRTPRA